ncbi:MAG: hypothetical protein ABIN01_25310 [Ferruginibacter sp.]
MKPFIVLLTVLIIALLAIKLISGQYDFSLAGRIAMCAMLVFTAIGHFIYTQGMAMMIPASVPFKTAMVYATGVLEIIAAVCLLIPAAKIWAGWFLILFFIALLPANVKAALQHIDYQKANTDGPGSTYLWFRIPLQVLFIVWVYLSSIRF